MSTIDQNGRITRRRFLEHSAAAFAAPAVLAAVSSAEPAHDSAGHNSEDHDSKEKAQPAPESSPMPAKIALEEHFVSSETMDASYGAGGSPDFRFQLEDIGDRRIAEMDRGGVELCILSLVGPGIRPFRTYLGRSALRGAPMITSPNISQSIPSALRASLHYRCRILKLPVRN